MYSSINCTVVYVIEFFFNYLFYILNSKKEELFQELNQNLNNSNNNLKRSWQKKKG